MLLPTAHVRFPFRVRTVRPFHLVSLIALLVAPLPLMADTEQKLRGAAVDDADWLTYGHGYSNQRYSGLKQIDRRNVSRLMPKWIYQTGMDGTFQTSPIVLDGMVYLTTPRNHIVALDGATGEVRWKYTHNMETDKPCCGTHNRGVAIGYGRVHEITADGRLIAVDRDNGKVEYVIVAAGGNKLFNIPGGNAVIRFGLDQ